MEVLKKVFEFSQFEENFIKNNTSFKDFISSNLSSFFKEDGYVCEMISSLQKNVNSDDTTQDSVITFRNKFEKVYIT